MWGRVERIPSWQSQEGRCSLPFLWSKGWRWALILGVYFLHLSLQYVGELPEFATLCPWIVASGPDVCFGMGGCLDLVVLVTLTLGLPLLGI